MSTPFTFAVLAAAAIAISLPASAAMPDAAHHVLEAAGPQAATVAGFWHFIVWLCTIVFGLILAALIIALVRAPRGGSDTPADTGAIERPERAPRNSVIAAVVASSLMLVALIVISVFTDRALARMPLVDALHIDVVAHQWWWEAHYDDQDLQKTFSTANEIHIPVGRPVIVRLKSDDVIHSLWVPSLAGKKDLIPGREATMQFRADRAGIYRGACAEFCGYEHALMAFYVVADPPDVFDAWAANQRKDASAPAEATAERGKQIFLSSTCAMCHGVRGTTAGGQHAPDLTHVASRATIAAGTLPNGAAELTAWIADPQKIKPGVNMPAFTLGSDDLHAVVAYVRSLQ